MSVDLQTFLSARLEGFRRNSDNSWQARCPICALEGDGDKQKQHLRIWKSGAFNCVKAGDDAQHNRLIRAFVYQDTDPSVLASLESTIIDPEPKLEADKVYDESLLKEFLPDHRYWMGRGISEEVLRKMEGGLHPPDVASKLSGRYVLPIRDPYTRRIIGWSGRLTNENSFGPKHKHLVRTSRALYPLIITGEHIKRMKKIVFVESVGNALALFTADIWCVGILLGLNLNSRWLGWLASAGLDEIIISTDNDMIGKPESAEAGNKAAEKLRVKLVPFFGEERVKIRLVQTRKDWGKAWEDKTGETELFKAELEGRGGVVTGSGPDIIPMITTESVMLRESVTGLGLSILKALNAQPIIAEPSPAAPSEETKPL